MMEEEREDAEEAIQEAATAAQNIKKDAQAKVSQESIITSKEMEDLKEEDANADSIFRRFTRLVKGKEKKGDRVTASLLAEAIDEAVGLGKLGQDKLTVAELQLLDDISRGSVVSLKFL